MRQVMQYLDGDIPLPELTPTNFSYSSVAFMQKEEFDTPWSTCQQETWAQEHLASQMENKI
jgi:hypothetical protein